MLGEVGNIPRIEAKTPCHMGSVMKLTKLIIKTANREDFATLGVAKLATLLTTYCSLWDRSYSTAVLLLRTPVQYLRFCSA
jgi:hypothetical protein